MKKALFFLNYARIMNGKNEYVKKVAKTPDFLRNQAFYGGDKRDRTADLLNAIQALSQLSYTPICSCGIPADLNNIAERRSHVKTKKSKKQKFF